MQAAPLWSGPLTEDDANQAIKKYIKGEFPFTKRRRELKELLVATPSEKEAYIRRRRYRSISTVPDDSWAYGNHAFRLYIRKSAKRKLVWSAGICACLMISYICFSETAASDRNRQLRLLERIAEEETSPMALNWAITHLSDKASYFQTKLDTLAAAGNPEAMFFSGLRSTSVAETERLIAASSAAGYVHATEILQKQAYTKWIAWRLLPENQKPAWYEFW